MCAFLDFILCHAENTKLTIYLDFDQIDTADQAELDKLLSLIVSP